MEWGSPLRIENAANIEIAGFKGRQSLGSEKPVIRLKNVAGAYIHDCQAAEGAGTFLEVAEGSKDILYLNNDLRQSATSLTISDDVNRDNVIESGNIR